MNSKQRGMDHLRTKRWDVWNVRLPNTKDQLQVIERYRRSGASTKSDFLRSCILKEDFKVIHIDHERVKIVEELSRINGNMRKIGVLINQITRSINKYHSIKVAHALLEKVNKWQEILEEQQSYILEIMEAERKRYQMKG